MNVSFGSAKDDLNIKTKEKKSNSLCKNSNGNNTKIINSQPPIFFKSRRFSGGRREKVWNKIETETKKKHKTVKHFPVVSICFGFYMVAIQAYAFTLTIGRPLKASRQYRHTQTNTLINYNDKVETHKSEWNAKCRTKIEWKDERKLWHWN